MDWEVEGALSSWALEGKCSPAVNKEGQQRCFAFLNEEPIAYKSPHQTLSRASVHRLSHHSFI